jgi:type II secretory pathway pseudopilin PulG
MVNKMMQPFPIRKRKPSEEGYMLVVVIFMLAILMLSLTVAAPVVRKEIQRDREVELMHRGKQYARAVKLYYRKFGAYPPTIDALVKTNDLKFLRKKYIDLSTGKEDWKIIRVGQQRTPRMGFFGMPLGAAGAIGTGGVTGATPFASTSGPGTGGTGTSSSTSPSGATGNPTDSSSGSSLPSPLNESAGASLDSGLSGQTFGGMPIMGFSPNSPKESILIYKKKNHYNEWEFLYDPIADQMMQGGGNQGAIGQPIGGSTTPVGGAGSATGFSLNLNSNGSNGGSNTSGSSFGSPTPTPPTPPSPSQ